MLYQKINEQEDNLIAKIKTHHEGLRKQVEKAKEKYIENSKKSKRQIEAYFDGTKDRQTLFNSWLNKRSDLSLANTDQMIREKIKQGMCIKPKFNFHVFHTVFQ